eukprot:4152963-Pleurochrysis_carterae.AAC.2
MTAQPKKRGAKAKRFSQLQEADDDSREDSPPTDAAGECIGDAEGDAASADGSAVQRKRRKRAGRSGLEQRGPPTVQGSGAMSGGASDEWQTAVR